MGYFSYFMRNETSDKHTGASMKNDGDLETVKGTWHGKVKPGEGEETCIIFMSDNVYLGGRMSWDSLTVTEEVSPKEQAAKMEAWISDTVPIFPIRQDITVLDGGGPKLSKRWLK